MESNIFNVTRIVKLKSLGPLVRHDLFCSVVKMEIGESVMPANYQNRPTALVSGTAHETRLIWTRKPIWNEKQA